MTTTPTEPGTKALVLAKPRMRFNRPEQTVSFTTADERMFARVYDEAPIVPETVGRVAEAGKMRAPLALSYQFDAHNELVKGQPKPSGFGDQLIRELMRRLREAKEYHELRAATVGDDVAAALGACSLTEKTVAALSEELKEQAEKQRKAEQEAREAEAQAQAAAEAPDAQPKEVAETAQAAAQARAKADAAAKALAFKIKSQGKQIAQATAAAVAAAKDGAQAAKDAQECFGFGNGTGDPSGGLPIEEKFRLARTIQKAGPSFRRFVEILGRMTRTALRKQASKTQHESGEIVDVGLGAEIDRLMDDEVVQLASPRLRAAALSRFASETMMQHEVDQREPMAKGDVVVLIDESGSMAGQKEAEAKGVALALAHVCAKQKRTLVVHFFQSRVTETIRINPQDAKAVENGMNVAMRKLGQLAGRGTAGGTSFDTPLLTAVETVRKGGMAKADVLMITDGECDVADKTVEALNELRADTGAKVYSMLIGCGGADVVAQFSDKVWTAETLLGRVAEDLFELI